MKIINYKKSSYIIKKKSHTIHIDINIMDLYLQKPQKTKTECLVFSA